MNRKKVVTFAICFVSLILGLGVIFLFKSHQKTYSHFAVIPHFMIQSSKVSEFYRFIKEKYYVGNSPDLIVLISPNHFFPNQKKIESVCSPGKVFYKKDFVYAVPIYYDEIDCNGGVFYNQGKNVFVKDHGLGEHFQWINKYFSGSKVALLSLPSYVMKNAEGLGEFLIKKGGNTLIIASVDFSHYKPEQVALKNDEFSYNILSSDDKFPEIRGLDVDCPSCLGVLYLMTKQYSLKIHQRYRDSSSSIVGYDLGEQNTSRQFLWRD